MLPYRFLICLTLWSLLSSPSRGDSHLNELSQQLTRAAEHYRSQQELCLKSEEKLKSLELEKKQKTFQLEHHVTKINSYLSALKKIQLIAPTAILNSSMTPQRLIQSTLILNSFIRHILKSTQSIRAELQALQTTGVSIEREKISAKRLEEQYSERLKEIEVLLVKKRQILKAEKQRRESLEKRIDHLAQASHNLHDLIQRLESSENPSWQKAKTPTKKPFVVSQGHKGKYQLKPVVGPIISSFGEKHEKLDTDGTGIIFQTRANSLVYAPTNAKVSYAGPFRKYNQILILSHGEKYHTLIVGLAQIEVSVGQIVLAGEPIGYTSPNNPSYLYMELRDQQKPINPMPWFP